MEDHVYATFDPTGTRPRGHNAAESDDTLFDEPSRWRAEAALALGLDGDLLLAAVSPGASCPSVLHSMAAAIMNDRDRLDLLVDLGAGVGGISEWFRRQTGAAVVAVDPSAGARAGAEALFPALTVRQGTAEASGMPTAIADAVLLSGVVSLIHDLDAVLTESCRVARSDGVIAIGDLFSSSAMTLRSGRNVFRGIETTTRRLAKFGWTVVEVGVGTTAPNPTWASAAAAVDEWIRVHRAHHPHFEVWLEDQRHLDRHAAQGDLVAAGLVARRLPRRRR
jgi:SAM-dependent methyltransferase